MSLLITQPRTTTHAPWRLWIISHFPTEEVPFSRHNFGWIGTRGARQPCKKAEGIYGLCLAVAITGDCFLFFEEKKKFQEKGSRMEWEVIHRVALQPHIIYILMISCFTSPQIILQNASLFIYILVNHSCFKPLAGRAHGRRFLSCEELGPPRASAGVRGGVRAAGREARRQTARPFPAIW